MKNKYLLLTLFTLSMYTKAQISSNHQKYWYYRNELLSKYVVLGKAPNECPTVLNDEHQGLSIPASSIDHGKTPKVVKWGDSPEILGMYVGTLATEYRLLVNSGYNGDKVKEELYYAMKAFEQLDARAEKFQYPGFNGSTFGNYPCYRNGFFTRLEASKEFFEKNTKTPDYPNRTFIYPKMNGSLDTYIDESGKVQLGTRSLDEDMKRGEFGSLDHSIYMLMGFALVKKYMEGESYTDPVSGEAYNFKNKAKENAKLMIDYFRDNDWALYIPNTNKSTLVNSVCKENDTGLCPPVEIQMFAWLLAKAGEWVTEQPSGTYSGTVPFWTTELGSVAQYPSGAIFRGIIDERKKDIDFSIAMLEALAAIGKPWGVGFKYSKPVNLTLTVKTCMVPTVHRNCDATCEYFFGERVCLGGHWIDERVSALTVHCYEYNGPEQLFSLGINYLASLFVGGTIPQQYLGLLANIVPDVRLCFTFPLAYFTLPDWTIVNTTNMALYDYYNDDTKRFLEPQFQMFPLLSEVLHEGEGGLEMPRTGQFGGSYYESILNAAPCKLPNSDNGPGGWRSANRWNKYYSAFNGDHDGSPGNNRDFNGLDYMLYYNIYCLKFKDKKYPHEPLIDRKIASGRFAGTASVYGLNKLTASTNVSIASGANITFNAGKELVLEPGFQTEANTEFVAQIKTDYQCSQSAGYYRQEAPSDAIIDYSKNAYLDSLNSVLKLAKIEVNGQTHEANSSNYIPLTSYIQSRNENTTKARNEDYFDVSIAPNPVKSAAKIEVFKNSTAVVYLQVFDALGKEIQTIKTLNQNIEDDYFATSTISLENAPVGVYTVKLTCEGIVKFMKIVKD